MTSIYQQAMGSDFQRMHPKIQERFGFSSEDQVACIGQGVMNRIWHGRFYTIPFLYLGAWRKIMVPDSASDVPFTIENYAYRDHFGRETITWIRSFSLPKPRRFDATMIYSRQRGRIVDYLGTHQHIAVDIDLSVDPRGGLALRSGAQRFYEGPVGFHFPMMFSGIAEVCEWYDDDTGRYRIEVDVNNRAWGPLFGYDGWFDVTWRPCSADDVPKRVRPVREEQRE